MNFHSFANASFWCCFSVVFGFYSVPLRAVNNEVWPVAQKDVFFTRDFQGTRFRRCSRYSSASMQLLTKLQPKKLGKCIAGSAFSGAATNVASCLLLTMAPWNLPR
jgi:hypothetical protein